MNDIEKLLLQDLMDIVNSYCTDMGDDVIEILYKKACGLELEEMTWEFRNLLRSEEVSEILKDIKVKYQGLIWKRFDDVSEGLTHSGALGPYNMVESREILKGITELRVGTIVYVKETEEIFVLTGNEIWTKIAQTE